MHGAVGVPAVSARSAAERPVWSTGGAATAVRQPRHVGPVVARDEQSARGGTYDGEGSQDVPDAHDSQQVQNAQDSQPAADLDYDGPEGPWMDALARGRRVSFAQNGEDIVLARALAPERRRGFWIDVGAGDPVYDSVTALFARLGWTGVNVEPLEAEHARLCAARPEDINLRTALGERRGEAILLAGPQENRGQSVLADLVDEGRREALDEEGFTPVSVAVSTLGEVVGDLLSTSGALAIDFLKIDVEGAEARVLAGMDWDRCRPRVLVIEATVPGTNIPAWDEWEGPVLAAGYCFTLFDGLNRYYVDGRDPEADDLIAALSFPVNVLDNYVPFAALLELHEADSARTAAQAHSSAAQAHSSAAEAHSSAAEAATAEALAYLATVTAAAEQSQSRAQAHIENLEARSESLSAELVEAHERAQAQAEAVWVKDEELRALGVVVEDLTAQVQAARGELARLEATRLLRAAAPLRRQYARLRARKSGSTG